MNFTARKLAASMVQFSFSTVTKFVLYNAHKLFQVK
jgi:hypothetical protein